MPRAYVVTNVGGALSHAMREIERANPAGAAYRGNREMLTDEILKDLMEGFAGGTLGNNAVSTDSGEANPIEPH